MKDYTITFNTLASVECSVTVRAEDQSKAELEAKSRLNEKSDWKIVGTGWEAATISTSVEHSWDSEKPEALVMVFAFAGIGCPFTDLSRFNLTYITREDPGVTFKPITKPELELWSAHERWDEDTANRIMSRPDYDWEKLSL